MSDQRSLFDVERTTPQACPVPHCGAVRTAGQDKVPTCAVDKHRALGGLWESRPMRCLNYPKPQHEPIPY